MWLPTDFGRIWVANFSTTRMYSTRGGDSGGGVNRYSCERTPNASDIEVGLWHAVLTLVDNFEESLWFDFYLMLCFEAERKGGKRKALECNAVRE